MFDYGRFWSKFGWMIFRCTGWMVSLSFGTVVLIWNDFPLWRVWYVWRVCLSNSRLRWGSPNLMQMCLGHRRPLRCGRMLVWVWFKIWLRLVFPGLDCGQVDQTEPPKHALSRYFRRFCSQAQHPEIERFGLFRTTDIRMSAWQISRKSWEGHFGCRIHIPMKTSKIPHRYSTPWWARNRISTPNILAYPK